jgi:Abnormal spindle-like microcephaly-assoc'd, ASPM-SPD-2-Hydin/Protein of unknown function (DUF1573)
MVGLSSCSGYTTAANTSGNGSGSGSGSTGQAGVLSPSSTTLAFGNVAVGTTGTQSVTVTNTGTAAVNIAAATIAGAGFTIISGNPSASVPVGQSITVQMQFAPVAGGLANGTLTVTSDASNSPLAIALSGTGMQPALTITPASLNFSNVIVGQSSSQNVTLTNSGNANLTMNLATISGTGFGMTGLALPKTIAAGSNISFSVQFTPTSTAAASGTITFTDNATNSPQTLTMTGSAVASGSSLVANPGSFNFNNVAVSSSSPETFTLTNSGNATVTINQVSTTGAGFSSTGLTVGQQIAAGASATFTSTFAPTTAGAASGSVTITSTATNPTLTIALSGTGTQGGLSANPASIPFGAVIDGASASVPVTLTNTGTAAVSITAHSITGTGFTLTGWTAPASLTPGQTTSFTVTFAPTTAGSKTGSVSITSNAPGSPLVINLTGSGTASQAAMTINPSPVAFNNINVGSNSTQTVTLTNTGNAALNISAATISGTGYTMNLTAPKTINAGANTQFTVTFAPTTSGSLAGSILITSNAAGSPATISLSGAGTQAQVAASPTSATFSSVIVGNSNSQPITLKNNGNMTLTFSGIVVTGAGMSVSGLTTSTTIAAGGSMSFNAVFTPTSTGTISGSVALTTNATPSSMTINLSGTGVAATRTVTANPTSLSFGTVALNTSSSLTSTLTNTGNANVTISGLTTTGAGFSASGVSNGTILTPGQTATLTVTFDPTTAGAVTGASASVASNATGSPTAVALSGTGQAAAVHSVLLQWDGSVTAGVNGYNVYRATSSGGYSTTPLNPAPVSTTTFTDATVADGQSYFYVVTAVDAGAASSDSNEVSVSIP